MNPNELKRYRGQRGPGVKTKMTHVNVRVPVEVLEYFRRNYTTYTAGMREVLTAWVEGSDTRT